MAAGAYTASRQRRLNTGGRSQAHVCHAACEGRGKRHASHAPVSLQSKVSRSVPASARSPGDDEIIFSQDVVTPDARGLGTERTSK